MARLVLGQMQRMGAQARRTERGYTLVEVMVVVIIVAVLAVLAAYGVRKYVYATKSTEAINMIGSIKAQEEAYKDETFQYLNVSTTIDTFYPNATPDKTKWAFDNPAGNNYANWKQLAVTSNLPVQFGYAVVAGLPGGIPIPQPGTTPAFVWPVPTEPWYVVKAQGNLDGDTAGGPTSNSILVSSSFTTEIYSENEGN